MALFKTSNPALGQNTFSDAARSQYGGSLVDASARMTLSGTVNKTGILLLCAIATAAWTWSQFMQTHDMATVAPELMLGALGGFIVAMVTIFKQTWAPVTAPIYALLEGLVLGGLSAVFEAHYPGIALEAVGLTFGTLFVMLFLYQSGVIKVTQKFRMGVVAATGGIMIFYLLTWLLSMFHITAFSSVFGSGQGVTVGAPKYMEWYAAFGIMVTLVWLYLEMLRLLSKMRRN
jgi:uncharacterized YccA/Bax inhibitor family protein